MTDGVFGRHGRWELGTSGELDRPNPGVRVCRRDAGASRAVLALRTWTGHGP